MEEARAGGRGLPGSLGLGSGARLAAPISIAYTHVHSIRVASGAEALVARVQLKDGTAGFGFTLNEDAGVARDMAAWDALGKSRGAPFHALMGGTHRKAVDVRKDELPALRPDWAEVRKGLLENRYDVLRVDPFAWGSVEMVQTLAASAAAFDVGVALLAPNAHPWEIQYCAALAATMKGEDTRIVLRFETENKSMKVKDEPGLGIDWSLEPAFGSIQWRSSTE